MERRELTERLIIPNAIVRSVAREVEHHHTLAPIRFTGKRDLTEKVRESFSKLKIDSGTVRARHRITLRLGLVEECPDTSEDLICDCNRESEFERVAVQAHLPFYNN